MTNSTHVLHPCIEIFSRLVNWCLSEGMKLCRCPGLMNRSRGGTPSCHERRQVRGKRRTEEEGRGQGGLAEKKKNEQRHGNHPSPNVTVRIQTSLSFFNLEAVYWDDLITCVCQRENYPVVHTGWSCYGLSWWVWGPLQGDFGVRERNRAPVGHLGIQIQWSERELTVKISKRSTDWLD